MANERPAEQSDIKLLISKGLEQGYLTYAEVNDHLPDDLVDPEQIEDIIGMINDMGIQVYDEAPDADALLMSDVTPAVADEVAVEAWHAYSHPNALVGRLIPGVRTLVNIPAGLARIPFVKFFMATFAGAYVWCTLLIGAGYLLGHEWMLIGEYIKTHLPLILITGFLLIAAYLVYHYRESLPFPRRMRQNSEELE